MLQDQKGNSRKLLRRGSELSNVGWPQASSGCTYVKLELTHSYSLLVRTTIGQRPWRQAELNSSEMHFRGCLIQNPKVGVPWDLCNRLKTMTGTQEEHSCLRFHFFFSLFFCKLYSLKLQMGFLRNER